MKAIDWILIAALVLAAALALRKVLKNRKNGGCGCGCAGCSGGENCKSRAR